MMTNEPKMAPQAPASGADQSKSANDAKHAAPAPVTKTTDKPLETKKT